MLGITSGNEHDEYTHNECTKRRMKKDDSDEGRIVVIETAWCVFRIVATH